MHLSIIFNTPAQTTSVISHLIPALYQSCPEHSARRAETVLLSLLHFLVAGYPSQSRYFEHLHSLPKSYLPADHPMRVWIQDLAQTLRSRNYARLDHLTNREACSRLIETDIHTGTVVTEHSPARPKKSPNIDLVLQALYTLAHTLRTKASETIWLVIRSAYRELSLPPPPAVEPASTRNWLCRSLALRPVVIVDNSDEHCLVDAWMAKRQALGDVRPREGVEGRWIVTKGKT